MKMLMLFFIIALQAIHVFGQTNKNASDTSFNRQVNDSNILQHVIVSATRQQQQIFLTPYSIEVANSPAQDMHLPRTTPEALMFTPGVFVQKTNHGGGSPFLRGLTGNQTLIMMDGVRFNNATFRFGPNQYPNLIDPFTIDRIEVLKGSGSVQYGSDAMGGVLHILTREKAFSSEPAFFGSVTGRITTQDMDYTGRAEAGFTNDKWMLIGGYTFRQFGDLFGGDTTGRQNPSGYKENNWNLKLKTIIGNNLTLTISSQQVIQKQVPLYHRVALENFAYYNFDPQRMLINYARADWKTSHRVFEKISLTGIFKQAQEGRQYHRNGNAHFYIEEDKVNTYGATVDISSKFSNVWSANSGLEWYYDRVASKRQRLNSGIYYNERGLYPDGANQANFSVFSLHHIQYKALTIEPGIRYNSFVNTMPAGLNALPNEPKSVDIKLKPASFVGNLSALYSLHKKHAFYVSFSNGYRAPGIDDMGTLGLVDFRYEVPAYDLRPEKNFNTDIGYRFQGKLLDLNLNMFYMHISDLISRVRRGNDSIQGYPVYIKLNDQEAYVKGFEVSGNWKILPTLSLKSFAAYQYGQNLTRNEPMRRIPPFNGLNCITWQRSNFYAAIEHQWAAKQNRLAQGDKDDNRIPAGGTPGWQVMNVHAGYTGTLANIRFSAANIFNADYRTHGSGINNMGRAVTLSVQLNIQHLLQRLVSDNYKQLVSIY